MIALLQAPGFDFGDLGSLIVFLLFVLLPVLKGLGEARQRKDEVLRKPPVRGSGREPRRGGGLDRWEQLLRGEVPEEPRPAERAAPAAPPARPRRRRAAAKVEPLRGRPSAFEGIPERAPDAQRASDVPLATFEAPRWSTTDEVSENALEVTGPPDTSSERFDRGAASGAALASLEERLPAATGAVETGSPAFGRLTVADWRRAVVLREVLGSPVALRGDPDLPGLG